MSRSKKQSNVFDLPMWMMNLQARRPEGTFTPDQVAVFIEINLLLNGDSQSLCRCIAELIKRVPIKNQHLLESFIAGTEEQMFSRVRAYLDVVRIKLAELPKETTDGKVEEPSTRRGDDDSWEREVSDWEDDSSVRCKRGSRGNRAVRAAKRQQADDAGGSRY